MRVHDTNGVRLLAILTDQFVADPKLIIWKAQETPMTDKCRYLWDQLGINAKYNEKKLINVIIKNFNIMNGIVF